MPGASAYYLGGAVVYTREGRSILADIGNAEMKGIRSASEPYAQLLAKRIRERFACDWGLSETGATGPTGNSYGDAAGHSCIAVAGPRNEVMTLETGSNDRVGNMHAFAQTAALLAKGGVSRLLVAGGETSGAVVQGLGIGMLEIGPEIDPGVPWTRVAHGPEMVIALKSGNFGAPDFFLKAWNLLR